MEPIGKATSVFNLKANKQGNKEGQVLRFNVRVLIASWVCLTTLVLPQRVWSQTTATPSPCNNVASIGLDTFCDPSATIQITGQPVVPGQTIYYKASLTRGLGQCCVTGGVVNVTTPDGVIHLAGNVGSQLICNPGDGVIGSTAGTNFPVIAYTVRAQDMGIQRGAFPCGFEPAESIQAQVSYTGGVNFCNGTCAATASTDNCNPVKTLALVVEKTVACATGQVCDASLLYNSSASGAKTSSSDPQFCYRFIYRNNGTANLNVTSVVDTVLGILTPPGGMAAGAAVTNFSGVTTHISTANNTVTIRGEQTSQSCYSTTLVASASASADVIPASIAVTKMCDGGPFKIGSSIMFNGIVTNTGNATLTGITVVDDQAGDVSGSLSSTTLAPGASATYSGSYSASGNGCGPFTNSVTAQGSVQLVCGGTVQATTNNICTVITSPGITVTKMCDGGPFKLGEALKFNGTVTNTGDVTLVNVMVSDNHAGTVLSGVTLAPGASTNYSGSYTPGEGCGPFTNTVTATGNDLCTGGQVQAQAQAVCTVLTSPGITVTKMCDGAPFKLGDPIKFLGTVTNTGDVTLVNVMVSDNHAGTVLSGVTLAPGASTNYSGSYSPGEGCGPFTNTVTASGNDLCTGGQVQAQAQAVCTVLTSPGITVTKMCDGGPFLLGESLKFKGTVTNTGDVTLVSISVVDDHAGSVLSGVTLAPGASTNYSGSYSAGAGCGPFTNTVTATGTDSCTGGQVQAQAQSVCTVITSPGITVTKMCDGAPFKIGDPIKFKGTVTNTGDVTLVSITVNDNHAGSVLSGVTLAPGASTNYSGSYSPGAGCGPFTNTVTATGTDLCTGGQVQAQAQAVCTVITAPGINVTKSCVSTNGMIQFMGTVTNTGDVTLVSVSVSDDHAGSVLSGVTLTPGASSNYSGSYAATSLISTDTVTATGIDLCAGGQVQAQAMAICGFNPCIKITKSVACNTTGTNCSALVNYGGLAQGAMDATHIPSFCFRYAVTNCGDQVIAITNVIDSAFGDITEIGFPSMLAPGVATNVYLSADLAESEINLVQLMGIVHNAPSLGPVDSSSTATAQVLKSLVTCNVLFERGGQVLEGNLCGGTKNVGVLAGGGPVEVHVQVCADAINQQSLTNCVITLSGVPGAPIVTMIPGVAAPGTCSDTLVTTLPDMPSMHMVRADVSCEGVLTHGCGPIQTACSNSVEICGTNCITVAKFVKCATVEECLSDTCSSDLSLYGSSATGAKEALFCYGVVISNCGDLDFTSITVTDTVQGLPPVSLSGLFPGGLAAGQSKTNFYSRSYPGFVGTKVNTVTVRGMNALGTASASANASAQLLTPRVVCDKLVSLNGAAPISGGTIEVPASSTNQLAFSVRVTNNGSVDLQNVRVIDTGTSGCPVSTNFITFLAKGAQVDIPLCVITGVTCVPPGTTINNSVTVTAEVSDNVCSIDAANCERITTSSSCNNSITLTCAPPGACRTTGGGKQPKDDTCPEVRYVTHGGQVGASFGVAGAPDCATGLGFNNPCIRGEYQHVRHIKGGLRGVFHAAGNGNQHDYDSLMCACLPCEYTDTPSPFGGCHPADRCYEGENPTSPGKKHALCNPGDRICGPEPRRAPANKICFSGVADYTETRGKKTPQSVVFRVDLEDRSEPGGAHPKGGKAPPDRYRMRMWFISAGSANTPAVRALRATVACKDATCEIIPTTLDCVGGATPMPNIDDGGDLDRGNRQIHPSTGASCH